MFRNFLTRRFDRFPSFPPHFSRGESFAVFQKLENASLGEPRRCTRSRERARAFKVFHLGPWSNNRRSEHADSRDNWTGVILILGLGRRSFFSDNFVEASRVTDRRANVCNARGRFDRFDNRDDYIDKWRDFAKRRLLFRIRFGLSLVSLARIFARRSGGDWWLRDLKRVWSFDKLEYHNSSVWDFVNLRRFYFHAIF